MTEENFTEIKNTDEWNAFLSKVPYQYSSGYICRPLQ